MPRKDRSYSAQDVARIYCLHLDPDERAEALRLLAVCDSVDEGGTAFLIVFFSALLDVLELTEDVNPLSSLMSSLVALLIDALNTGMTQAEVVDRLAQGVPIP